jgi:hypothetical protein
MAGVGVEMDGLAELFSMAATSQCVLGTWGKHPGAGSEPRRSLVVGASGQNTEAVPKAEPAI